MQARPRTKGSTAGAARPDVHLPLDQIKLYGALGVLLVLTGLAIAGPWGLLAWSEHADTLAERKLEIAALKEERNALRNRVMLLDPNGADPDLASELVRRDLGVLHTDEVVVTLPD